MENHEERVRWGRQAQLQQQHVLFVAAARSAGVSFGEGTKFMVSIIEFDEEQMASSFLGGRASDF